VLLTRQSHGWYAPDDPKSPRQNLAMRQTYFKAVGELLSDRKGQVVHLEEELGGDPWIVAEAVECWRRLGWVIEGERGRPGYRFVAACRPKRWLRLDGVFVDYEVASLLRFCGYHGPIEIRPKRPTPVAAVNQTDIPLDTTLSESDPMPEWWREPEPLHVEPPAGQVAWC